MFIAMRCLYSHKFDALKEECLIPMRNSKYIQRCIFTSCHWNGKDCKQLFPTCGTINFVSVGKNSITNDVVLPYHFDIDA